VEFVSRTSIMGGVMVVTVVMVMVMVVLVVVGMMVVEVMVMEKVVENSDYSLTVLIRSELGTR
jgi:hypothetical protein